jgi:hypothetical protein
MLLATQNLKRLNKIRDGLLEMVLANCQQLCVFRISAADAKEMEQELQEKVTIKHIISQPTLHCYARLSLPGYPLQILSVALAHPASWQNNPILDQQVKEIQRTNQDRYLPAGEVDRLYEEHLRQFLNVKAAADRVQREARAARKKRQEDADANQLAAELQAAQFITGTKQAVGSPPVTHTSEAATEEEQKRGGSHPRGTAATKSTRNHRHRRSRRMGQKHVGAPPPEPTTAHTNTSSSNADEGNYPLPGSGGSGSFGGGSWGRSWGYAGHEGRERG